MPCHRAPVAMHHLPSHTPAKCLGGGKQKSFGNVRTSLGKGPNVLGEESLGEGIEYLGGNVRLAVGEVDERPQYKRHPAEANCTIRLAQRVHIIFMAFVHE
jgi:hypothetical protein